MKKTIIFIAALAVSILCLVPSGTSEPEMEPAAAPTAESTAAASATAVSTDVTAEAATPVQETAGTYRYRGILFGQQGNVLWYTDGEDRKANERYDEAFANLLSDFSEVKLDSVLGPSDYRSQPDVPAYLRQKNPTPCYVGTYPLGQSVVLTCDEDLQLTAYEWLKAHDYKGCICKLEDGGAVRIAASYPSFSQNAMVAGEASAWQRDVFNNQCFVAAQPGSVFKILSATVAKAHGMTVFEDPGMLAELDIHNWDYGKSPERYPVQRGIADAIRSSSNCVFAEVFYELGAAQVKQDLDTYYCFSQPLDIDGVTVTQTEDMRTNASLARCGFGQRLSVSPLYLCAAGLGAVTGRMVQPYLAASACDTVTGESLAQIGSTQVLSEIPAAYTEELLTGMRGVTEDLGLEREGYRIYTKTGTAEINHSGYGDILSVLTILVDERTGAAEALMLVVQNPEEHGLVYASGLKSDMQELLALLT